MNKLEGLPTIHYISLEDSIERRSNLENWFKRFNITDYIPHIFKRFEKYNYTLKGTYVHLLEHHSKGPITSHLLLLKDWYENTTEPYTLIVEDDLSLEPVNYWNFTWKEFFQSLPKDWNCVQFVIVREYYCNDYIFEDRKERDWCAAAYLIKREYAKLLLDLYYYDEIFNLEIENLHYPPVVEHILFTNKPGTYCFPLFVEDCFNTKSSLLPENAHVQLINGQGEYHHHSYVSVMNWWKTKGLNFTISDIFQNFMEFDFKSLKEKYNLNITGIIHVGAHYGQEVPDYVDCGIKNIVLFEPLKDTFDILSNNVKNINANIILNNVALGSSQQTTTMFVSDNEGQSSSILVPSVHLTHHPNVNFPGMEEVTVDILNNYNYNFCNYLHIDVQGYELEVLKGATETLEHIDYVYCEVNRAEVYEGNAYVEEIDEFLKHYGMERVETYWMGDIWGDALYIKKQKNNYNVSKTCQIQDLNSIYDEYFGNTFNGFFVEVGAYDGESFSNTSCLADAGWRGIYIEPVEEFYQKCLERHTNNDVSVVQCAIGETEKEIDIYINLGLTTTNKDMVNIYSEINWSVESSFEKRKCSQIRLETLLNMHSVQPKFEVLVVDVESNETSVFNSFDLKYWSPKMIIVELIDEHPTFQRYDSQIKINQDLRNRILTFGYTEIYKDEINTVFVKQNLVKEK